MPSLARSVPKPLIGEAGGHLHRHKISQGSRRVAVFFTGIVCRNMQLTYALKRETSGNLPKLLDFFPTKVFAKRLKRKTKRRRAWTPGRLSGVATRGRSLCTLFSIFFFSFLFFFFCLFFFFLFSFFLVSIFLFYNNVIVFSYGI